MSDQVDEAEDLAADTADAIASDDVEQTKAEDEAADHSVIPDVLCETGREVWLRVAPVLTSVGRLKRSDIESFTRYCDLTARFVSIAKDIQKRGEIVEVVTYGKSKNDPDATTVLRPHPALKDYRALSTELRQMDREFGMTPKSRAELVSRELGHGGLGGGGGDLFDGSEAETDDDDENPFTFH